MPIAVEIPDYEVCTRVTLDAASTALVIIDMQNDFVLRRGHAAGPRVGTRHGARDQPSARARTRGSGMRVVFTQDTHNEGDPEFGDLARACARGQLGLADRRRDRAPR